MITRTADAKGRITLGGRFANQTVIVREVHDTEVVVTLARVVPAREAWLRQQPKTKASGRPPRAAGPAGLREARARRFAKPPDLKADAPAARRLADRLRRAFRGRRLADSAALVREDRRR
jgi:hypothetical protein